MTSRHVLCSLMLASWICVSAASAGSVADDLAELDLRDLMNVEVISVAKDARSLQDTAAAVTILTADDISRAGVTSVQDALRLVPGMHVGQISGNTWAITARGFNGRAANKMLVLVDGRSLYSPLLSGTRWEEIDIPLESIARIEVVRGPGGTLWGPNAATGIINIITKSARETPGTAASIALGDEERWLASVQHGARVGSWDYRVEARGFRRDEEAPVEPQTANDEWESRSAHLRLDRKGAGDQTFAFGASLYDGRGGQLVPVTTTTPPYFAISDDDIEFSGGAVWGRWEGFWRTADASSLQVSFARSIWGDDELIKERRNTVEADFQAMHGTRGRGSLVWGAGLRTTTDTVDGSYTLSLVPDERTNDTVSAFSQWELPFAGERGVLTIGAKFLNNDFTGFEIQPSVRALWRTGPQGRLWAAYTRAVGEPARVYVDSVVNAAISEDPQSGLPLVIRVLGNDDLDAEVVSFWEAGWRTCASEAWCFDLALFHSEFEKIQGVRAGDPFFEDAELGPSIVVPIDIVNADEGSSDGAEIVVRGRLAPRWRIELSHSFIDFDFRSTLIPEGVGGAFPPAAPPEHQTRFLSRLDISPKWSVDATLYLVDDVPDIPGTAYERLDLRIARGFGDSLTLEIVGQNLLEDRHREFSGFLNLETQVERGYFGRATWRF